MAGRAAERLLARMRVSKSGWSQGDLRRLYLGFGFEVDEGGNHTLYIHPVFPQLRATVPRHSPLPIAYANHAVKLIDELVSLEMWSEFTEDADA